jgi:hypothetical protein
MLDSKPFGIEPTSLPELNGTQIAWPKVSDGDKPAPPLTYPPIRARAMRLSADDDHCWLVFECDGMVVTRWVTLPEKQPQQEHLP